MLPPLEDPDLLVGLRTGDDAAVYRLGEDLALVLTVDFFPPIVDDPYWYGAIAAANSLSDIYAMGGRPLLALNILCYPVGMDKAPLAQILKGAHEKVHEAGALIVGGHTIDDAEPKYGLAVTGLVKPGAQVTNAGARPGDALVLTKPIGTGIITTAAKQDQCPPQVLEQAIQVMATLNKDACDAMLQVGVHACTDVTGFGLLGHLDSVLKASGVGARIRLKDVPLLPGARELAEAGTSPGGTHRNLKAVEPDVRWPPGISKAAQLLLCDAQTSGGLLIALPQDKAPELARELEVRNVQGQVVGEVTEGRRHRIEVGA